MPYSYNQSIIKMICHLIGHNWSYKKYWNAARGSNNEYYKVCSRCNKVRHTANNHVSWDNNPDSSLTINHNKILDKLMFFLHK